MVVVSHISFHERSKITQEYCVLFVLFVAYLTCISSNVFSTASVGLAIALNIGKASPELLPNPYDCLLIIEYTGLGGAPGQILGVWIYKADEAELGYPTGHWTNAGLLFFSAMGCVLLRIYYGRLNAQLRRNDRTEESTTRLYTY